MTTNVQLDAEPIQIVPSQFNSIEHVFSMYLFHGDFFVSNFLLYWLISTAAISHRQQIPDNMDIFFCHPAISLYTRRENYGRISETPFLRHQRILPAKITAKWAFKHAKIEHRRSSKKVVLYYLANTAWFRLFFWWWSACKCPKLHTFWLLLFIESSAHDTDSFFKRQ